MSQNNEQNQNQQGGNDSKKTEKKFQSGMKKLIAVLGGEALLAPTRLGGESLTNAIAELAKDERETLVKEFKAKATALISRKRAYDKFLKEEERKMAKAKEDKQKEFNNELESLFKMIESIQDVEKEYYSTLGSMSNNAEDVDDSEENS